MRALTYPNHKLKPSINTTGAIRFVLISDFDRAHKLKPSINTTGAIRFAPVVLISDFDFDRAPERQG
jgi:hypothetical protein